MSDLALEPGVSEFLQALVESSSRLPPLTTQEWERGLRRLRQAALLARLGLLLGDAPVPDKVAGHLEAARTIATRHRRTVLWEVDRIRSALAETGAPVILLKGAAYVVAGLAPARGRLTSDVDLLVPRAAVPATEAALLAAGWEPVKRDPYDQRYYREWMHELPPLRHALRGTVVDVHHAILPLTARSRPDTGLLFASAIPAGGSGFSMLCPTDMVLHSATHLFFDGDLKHGIRDLIDIHDLLGQFGRDETFWRELIPRAQRLQLARPLFYALRYCRIFLHTPIPDTVVAQARVGAPSVLVLALMDLLVARTLVPGTTVSALAAQWLLYVRSHYQRMPLHLLLPHLWRKALVRQQHFDEVGEQ